MAGKGLKDWATNLGMVTLMGLTRILPYRWRVPAFGWITARIVAPLTGHEKRALDNLALVRPDLPAPQARAIARAAADNAARTLIEMYSQRPFLARCKTIRMTGPGAAILEQARKDRRPIIAVSGHFGNYHAVRAVFANAGHAVGGLYRPMFNPYFNAHYVRHLEAIASPSFEQGRRGLAQMIRHLRAGNMIALLTDQRDEDGALLTFFGQPALTPLSAAELALKYDALLIPAYGIRHDNGLDFDVFVEEPIAHTTPEEMMQAVNDSLEAQVRRRMGQWMWLHRRWHIPPKARRRLSARGAG